MRCVDGRIGHLVPIASVPVVIVVAIVIIPVLQRHVYFGRLSYPRGLWTDWYGCVDLLVEPPGLHGFVLKTRLALSYVRSCISIVRLLSFCPGWPDFWRRFLFVYACREALHQWLLAKCSIH